MVLWEQREESPNMPGVGQDGGKEGCIEEEMWKLSLRQ